MYFTAEDYHAAAAIIQNQITIQPQIGLILGSGLAPLAESIEAPTIIPYTDIPHWRIGSVVGHVGRLVIGHLEKQPVLVMQGRTHFYEGITMQEVGFPVRVMQALGIHTLIVTNAAGGVNPNFRAGDLMVIKDHINFTGMAGNNPLIGPNDEMLGPRFVPMTAPYDRELRRLAFQVAEREGIPLHEGVYVSLAGPAFETPAEIRMLRVCGGDAVGMSTAPEVLVAKHAGMRVFGVSSITNVSIDAVDTEATLSHEEVLEVGKLIVPRLIKLLQGLLRDLPPFNR